MAKRQRLLITVPTDVRQWLRAYAAFNGGTQSGEVVRALRAQMKRLSVKASTAPNRTESRRIRPQSNA